MEHEKCLSRKQSRILIKHQLGILWTITYVSRITILFSLELFGKLMVSYIIRANLQWAMTSIYHGKRTLHVAAELTRKKSDSLKFPQSLGLISTASTFSRAQCMIDV